MTQRYSSEIHSHITGMSCMCGSLPAARRVQRVQQKLREEESWEKILLSDSFVNQEKKINDCQVRGRTRPQSSGEHIHNRSMGLQWEAGLSRWVGSGKSCYTFGGCSRLYLQAFPLDQAPKLDLTHGSTQTNVYLSVYPRLRPPDPTHILTFWSPLCLQRSANWRTFALFMFGLLESPAVALYFIHIKNNFTEVTSWHGGGDPV